MEKAAADDQLLGRTLDVQDARASGHPLGVAIGDDATAAVRVLVLEDTVDHVGDRLEAPMRMPRRALGFARRVLDLAHLVEVNERIELLQRHPLESAANGK